MESARRKLDLANRRRYCMKSLERNAPRDLNVARRTNGSVPGTKTVRTCARHIGVECASAVTARLNKSSDAVEMVRIEDVKRIST
jgi:hypothetical protein